RRPRPADPPAPAGGGHPRRHLPRRPRRPPRHPPRARRGAARPARRLRRRGVPGPAATGPRRLRGGHGGRRLSSAAGPARRAPGGAWQDRRACPAPQPARWGSQTMSTEENRNLVAQAFAAWERGDSKPFFDIVADDVTWTVIGTTP